MGLNFISFHFNFFNFKLMAVAISKFYCKRDYTRNDGTRTGRDARRTVDTSGAMERSALATNGAGDGPTAETKRPTDQRSTLTLSLEGPQDAAAAGGRRRPTSVSCRDAFGEERRVLRSGFVWQNEDAKRQAPPAPAAAADVSSHPLSRFRCKNRKPVQYKKSLRSCTLLPCLL